MNLTELSNFAKKYYPYIGVISILLILIFLISLKFTSPQKSSQKESSLPPPVIRQDPKQKPPTSYDFSNPSVAPLPKELSIFTLERFTVDEALAKKIASAFGIANPPTKINENTHDGRMFVWSLNGTTLTVSQSTVYYKTKIPQIQTTAKSEDELQQIAQKNLGRLNVIDELQPNNKKTYLTLSGDDLKSAASFDEAKIIEFSFDKNLAGLPLLNNSANPAFAKVQITKDGQIINMSTRFFRNYGKDQSYALKSKGQAEQEIQKNMGVVANVITLDKSGQAVELYSFKPVDLQTLVIKSIYPAYYLEENNTTTIQPILVFQGETQSLGNKVIVNIYLPAILSTSAKP